MSEITNELYKDFIRPNSSGLNNNSVVSSDNKLERSPSNDKFELQTTKKQKSQINKDKLIKLGIGLAAISATTAAFFCGKKVNTKLILAQGAQIEKLASAHGAEIEKLTSAYNSEVKALQKQIDALMNQRKSEDRILTEALEGILNADDKTAAAKGKLIQYYRDLIANAKLSYNPIETESATIYEKTDWAKIYTLQDIKPLKTSEGVKDLFDISKLKEQLRQTGKIVLDIPSEKEIQAVKSPKAFIDGKTIPHLGEVVDSEITTAYGKRINWSNEKIARDIMQNFYDGHGNTLDGVQVLIEKLPSGKTKVKISGKGFYEYGNLQLLGAGNKCENPYNAGGFGEGAKVLVANLLGKGDTSKVTYSCADWKLSFCAPKNESNVIQRKLEKVSDILDGNSIEFETDNQDLVSAIIDSINYFKHSKNPDFQQLTYNSKDFGFKFLGEKSGNIYLTQRFEFEGDGKWEGNVDGLNLIFNKKPDPVEYKKLIGVDLPKDRDRTSLTFEDIENLTRYFAHDMSDDELMSAIYSTKPMWGKIDPSGKKQSALTSFLKGLIQEASQRQGNVKYETGLKLDLGDERFVALDRANETVVGTLSEYNYKFLPGFFKNIGIEKATDAFEKLSVHTPIAPSEVEVKKLKLLEEGLAVVQDNIQKALKEHLSKADINFNTVSDIEKLKNNHWFNELIEYAVKYSETAKEIMSKYSSDIKYISRTDIEKVSDEDMAKLILEVSNTVTQRLKALATDPDNKEIDKIAECIKNISGIDDNVVDVKVLDYIRTLKDFRLITKEDISKPRYIFDRHSEIAKNTLGEAIIKGMLGGDYKGHWVDREYLNTADFMQLLGTWIHEVCHKSGGDGTSEFTYALTDMLRILLRAGSTPENCVKLSALEEIFNQL